MIKAAIFDVDGVLVDSPHEQAWGDTLRHLMESEWPELAGQTDYAPELYTSEVYQRVVAGKPRHEGAAALLAHFRIPDPDQSRVRLLCSRKQDMIERLIDEGRFRAFDDALRLLLRAKAGGILVAAASSSKNANKLMSKVDLSAHGGRGVLLEAFDANVCGRELKQGKPHPGIFLSAAEALGVAPEVCLVVEDAPSGVEAAKAGGMMCIGIARNDDEHLLTAARPDRVVTSLDDIDLIAFGVLGDR